MELGGKDVCIICDDADLDLAAKNIIKGGFSYSGQRCTAVKIVRLLMCSLSSPVFYHAMRSGVVQDCDRERSSQVPGCHSYLLAHY